MNPIRFRDAEHESFYYRMLEERQCNDGYHRALFYTLGISRDSRSHIRDLFDFSNGGIKPEGLKASWQTGSSIRVCRLAFILWKVGRNQAGNATPRPTNYSIAATLSISLKQFAFDIRIIAEARRGRSSG